ncbi:MAG: holo-ACP synthase [Burkholderiales bacterium]|nr:holo-ACP synthase [Burkholderiales bacterium]
MIFGIGTDMVQQSRITDSINRFGERFEKRILTEREYSQLQARPRDAVQRTRFLAQRFAAKEAFSKALGTGIRDGVAWRDMGVHNEPSGKPCLHLSAKLDRRVAALGIRGMHVTLTDEAGMTVAVVILEK